MKDYASKLWLRQPLPQVQFDEGRHQRAMDDLDRKARALRRAAKLKHALAILGEQHCLAIPSALAYRRADVQVQNLAGREPTAFQVSKAWWQA